MSVQAAWRALLERFATTDMAVFAGHSELPTAPAFCDGVEPAYGRDRRVPGDRPALYDRGRENCERSRQARGVRRSDDSRLRRARARRGEALGTVIGIYCHVYCHAMGCLRDFPGCLSTSCRDTKSAANPRFLLVLLVVAPTGFEPVFQP